MKKTSTLSLAFLLSTAATMGVACGDGEPNQAPSVATGGNTPGDGDGDGDGDIGECAADQDACGSQCASVQSDFNNCGECENACGEDEACFQAECIPTRCGTGSVECDGTCTNLQTDANNCGDCGDACASGEACSEGQCVVSCQDGFLLCDGVCVDPSKDRDFCGATSCDEMITGEGAGGASSVTVCDSGDVCVDGDCVADCPSGTVECGGGCIDPFDDPSYCGATDCSAAETSGDVCEQTESCVVGECREFVRQWSTGQVVNNQVFSTTAFGQALGTDGDGNAIVVWREYTDEAQTTSGIRLFSRRFEASTKTWGDIMRVDDGTDRINDGVKLGVTPDGSATAVWIADPDGDPEVDTDPTQLRMARYNPVTGAWGASTRVDAFDEDVESLDVAAAGNGDVHMVWLQVPAGETWRRVHYSRYDNATQALTTPVEINGYGEDDACSLSILPKVAANAVGDAGIVFQEGYIGALCTPTFSGSESHVFGMIYDKDLKTWSLPSDRADAPAVTARAPEVAIDANGNVTLIWAGKVEASGDEELYGTKYLAGATWQGITTIAPLAGAIRHTAVSGADDGGVAIALNYRPDTTYNIQAVLVDSDFAIITNQLLRTGVSLEPFPVPTYAADGTAFVSWTNGSSAEVSTYEAEGAGAWVGPIALDAGVGAGAGYTPFIAAAPSGQVYSTWYEFDGIGDFSLYFARYD